MEGRRGRKVIAYYYGFAHAHGHDYDDYRNYFNALHLHLHVRKPDFHMHR